MMELQLVKCIYCGNSNNAEFVDNKDVVCCLSCERLFLVEYGKKFFNKCQDLISQGVQLGVEYNISNLRRRLDTSIKEYDYLSMIEAANKILDLLPEDFLSGYYFALAGKK